LPDAQDRRLRLSLPGRRALLGVAAITAVRPAIAQPAFPNRSVRLVVGWPPGGGVDAFGRILAPTLGERLGQAVVIENIGGASGRLGSLAVARAAADGQTLLLANDTFAATEALPVAGAQSFRAALTPVVQAVEAPNILATHPRSGLGDMAGFAAACQARPGALNVGVPGIGSAQHLTFELVLRSIQGFGEAPLRAEPIAYRGGGPLIAELIAGKLDAGIVTLGAAAEHVKDGRLHGLAVTTRRRNASVPGVPTLAETVAPGFHLATWQGLFAPAGTPTAALRRVQEATGEALGDAALLRRLAAAGFEPALAPAAEFSALVAGTIERFAAVVAEAGIRADGA
jgi:tripartite-type tricarboxylate transporter receptor subunit TctC